MNPVPKEPGYLTTMQAAQRYNVSTETLRHWVSMKGFPDDCRKRHGQFMLWHQDSLDAWLRSRHVGTVGTRPRWLGVVGHKAA